MIDARQGVLRGLIVVALSALALIAKFPSYPLIFADLNNAAHAPLFGALAAVWLHWLRQESVLARWQRYAAAFVLAFAIGGFIELIQPAFGRGAEILDLVNDVLGAIAGLALAAACELRRKSFVWIGVAAMVPVLWPIAEAANAYAIRAREFPTLLGKDTLAERYFINSYGIELVPAMLPSQWRRSDDPMSLKIRISDGRYPRITLDEPQPDWRGYSRLMLDMTNPDTQPLTLSLRVHDRAHDNNRADDRFNRKFTMAASERRVLSFPLVEIAASPAGREMDMSRIAGVIVLGDGNPDQIGREYYLTRLWLE